MKDFAVANPYRSWPLEVGIALIFFCLGAVVKTLPLPLTIPFLLLGIVMVVYVVAQPGLQWEQSTWGAISLVIFVVSSGATMGITELIADRSYFYVMLLIRGSMDKGPYDLSIINNSTGPFTNVSIRITNLHIDPSTFKLETPIKVGDVEIGFTQPNLPPLPTGRYQFDLMSREMRFTEYLEIGLNEKGLTDQQITVRRGYGKILFSTH